MILVVLAISLVMFIFGITVIYDRLGEDAGEVVMFFGGLALIVVFIATILITIGVVSLNVIDDRIAMYEEENMRIEQQIATVVEQYQKYETDIFMEVAPESAVSMIALYPELKSDALVATQIEVYVENNKTIRDLKDKQISGGILRWWLYFGGRKSIREG